MTQPNGFSFLRIRLAVVFSVLLISAGNAQTNNSPYSVHGIGDITDNLINRTSGLSSTGIAYRSNRNLITDNPASLSALDNQFFIGEIGINSKYVNYTGGPVSQTEHQSSDITFRRVTFGTKIFKHWGSAVGIVPYTTENYEYTSVRPLGYNGDYIQSYTQGYGGINKVFWANGYEFFNHLSVGITSSYLFGSITNKNIISGTGSSEYLSKSNNTFYSNFHFEYGLQYYTAITPQWDITIGGVLSNQANLNTDQTVNVINLDSSVLRTKENIGTFNIPTSYGVGFSVTRNKKYTLLADYRYQNWGSQQSTTGAFSYENSQRASIGFEISKKKIAYNTLFETSFVQAGLYYNKTYVIVNGKPIEDYGGTLSTGVNSKRSPLSFILVLQYGVKGTTANNLVKENYFNASFIFSFRDLWYTRGRKFE